MTIRKATKSDIPALNHLLQQILTIHHQARPDIFEPSGQKFQIEELEELIQNPASPIFVYEKDDVILGHLFCEIRTAQSSVLKPVKTLFIEDLCVDETARGQKIGEQLYDFAFNYAKELGCYNLTLNVWNDNTGALRFYERQGMKAQQTRMEVIL